jgi:hypothetical protein
MAHPFARQKAPGWAKARRCSSALAVFASSPIHVPVTLSVGGNGSIRSSVRETSALVVDFLPSVGFACLIVASPAAQATRAPDADTRRRASATARLVLVIGHCACRTRQLRRKHGVLIPKSPKEYWLGGTRNDAVGVERAPRKPCW